MLLQPFDELNCGRRIIASNKIADFDQVALGVVAKPELAHALAGLKALFQPSKDLLCLAHASRC